MSIDGLVESLVAVAEAVARSEMPERPFVRYDYLEDSCITMIGSDDEFVIVPMWIAKGDLEQTLRSEQVERLCAALDVAGKGAVSQSIRAHVKSLLDMASSCSETVDRMHSDGLRKANRLCTDWVGMHALDDDAPLIDAEFLAGLGRAWDKTIGGNFDKRMRLASCLQSIGPQGIIVMNPDVSVESLSAEEVASRYWSILGSANAGIARARWRLKEAILRAVEYLRALPGDIVDAQSHKSDKHSALIRADEASRLSRLDADTIRKRARRDGWTTKKSGRMNCYRLEDLERTWPSRRFRPDSGNK